MQANAQPDAMSTPGEMLCGGGGSQPSVTPTETTARRRWTRFAAPTLADALFVVVLLRGLQLGATAYFNDPGTGWHLRTGAEIVAAGHVPVIDTFSHTRSGAPWVETQWLADSVMYLTFSAAGFGLLALCTATVLAGLFRWIYRTHLSYNGWPAVSLIVTLAAACAASGHFLARPLLASTIGIPLTFWWATEYARGRMSVRRLWWLVPIAALWTNLHPGVLGGIATVGLCGIALAVQRSSKAFPLLAVSLAMGAATLLNPYGVAWHGWIARLMDMPTLAGSVQEWMPPVWTSPDAVAAMLLVAVAVVGVIVRRTGVSLAEGLVIVFWVTQGVQSYRHLPVASLIVALQLGRILSDVRVASPSLLFQRGLRAAEVRVGGGLASVAVVVMLMVCLVTGTSVPAFALEDAGPPANRYSAGAVHFLRETPPAGPMFNALAFGGQLIRALPEMPVFIDDRFGMYGEEFVQEYIVAVSEPDERLGALLDRWGIETAMVIPNSASDRYLSSETAWTERYRDAAACVYGRK